MGGINPYRDTTITNNLNIDSLNVTQNINCNNTITTKTLLVPKLLLLKIFIYPHYLKFPVIHI